MIGYHQKHGAVFQGKVDLHERIHRIGCKKNGNHQLDLRFCPLCIIMFYVQQVFGYWYRHGIQRGAWKIHQYIKLNYHNITKKALTE